MDRYPRRRRSFRVLLWVLCGAALPLSQARAVDARPEGEPVGNWYYVEVVVFQRPGELDDGSGEQLARVLTPRLPAGLSGFRPADDRYGRRYQLEPETRLCLTFPFLDHAALSRGAPEADPDEPSPQATAGLPPPRIEPRLAPDPLLDYLRAEAEFERSLTAASYRWPSSERFTLSREASRLSRSPRFELLLHGRWLQPVPARDAPEPLLVQAAPRAGANGLEGVFEVTLGRYLHFGTQLYYHEPLLGSAPLDRPLPPPGVHPAPAAPQPDAADLEAVRYVALEHNRRLRSGELHYIDHPKLGMLVRIDPVLLPTALSAAREALEKAGE